MYNDARTIHNQMQGRDRGISLIALVLIIVVIVILGAVGLILILRQEPNVEQTDDVVVTEGLDLDINGVFKKEYTQKLSDGRKVTIPKGFRVADLNDDGTVNKIPKQSYAIERYINNNIDNGIVVIGPDNSEFVWIPVKDINSMIMCENKTADDQCNIKSQSGVLKCVTHNASENLVGKLYASSVGNVFDNAFIEQTYSINSGIRESSVIIGDGTSCSKLGFSSTSDMKTKMRGRIYKDGNKCSKKWGILYWKI